jgi:signal transduction histidine kinase
MNDVDELSALRDRVRQLEEAIERRDRLLSKLGHELRNPLAAIKSAAEVLRLTMGDEQRVQKTYAILERQTDEMVKLIDGATGSLRDDSSR